ncbi:MAG: galactose mutarotase [Acidobacteriaceae bacterium]|nr:galactose mutarotase [Acidobacteriaceae bacterium]
MSTVTKREWGSGPAGEPVDLFTLRNGHGTEASITNYGGRLVSLKTADRQGRFEDIVLGFNDLSGYLQKNPFFGALVGRYANRIANARFQLDGKTYELARNNGQNAIHGGFKGFDKVVWRATERADQGAVELRYFSRDGEEGYPGNLQVEVTYTLTEANELRLDYSAMTDAPTVVNLTNHSYFDLTGQAAGKILDHVVTIHSDRFTPVNAKLIPTGELKPVSGTPFDFRQPTPIGLRINEPDEQLRLAIGYDHNFVLDGKPGAPSPAARVTEPVKGRVLEVLTTQPGVQFYTGNHLDGSARGKGGVAYGFRFGFCLETQHFPDSPNHPEFPSTELRPGEEFRQTTIFRFSTQA